MRRELLFNENWLFEGNPVMLPHTWNAEDGQTGGAFKRGAFTYTKVFPKTADMDGQEVWVEFGAAAMMADVKLNGVHLFHHEGGYSAFRVNLTPALKEENILEVVIDNSRINHIYPHSADFTFYGGLYRDVTLYIVPKTHFALDYHGSKGIKITPIVNLEKQSADIVCEAWASENASTVTFMTDNQQKTAEVVNGYAKTTIHIDHVHLWNGIPDPYLYHLRAVLDSGDEVTTTYGCRTYHVDSEQGFFLNGKPYHLHGVAKHQDWSGVGNAVPKELLDIDMSLIREIGATTIRLAHYQHPQYFYDLCDQNGLIVWAEIPYITNHISEAMPNTISQMTELVIQNYHHPSIVCWGLSNEISILSEVNDELLNHHQKLNDLCHHLDATRLTTMAHVNNLPKTSPLHTISDIESYNLYFGWYVGNVEDNAAFFDEYHKLHPERCVGMSEYGADANPAFQTGNPVCGDYSETYQTYYHEQVHEILAARPYIWATHVWNMFDFAASGRHEGGVHGRNQKGLVTIDRKIKKDAFYMYKSFWNNEPMVHVCGRRYIDRIEDITEVKVYSNCSPVTLYVDGKEFETKEGNNIFVFRVPISTEHEIKAIAGTLEDKIRIHKVSEPNMSYVLQDEVGIINWFEDDAFKANFYSIKDTIADLTTCTATKDMVTDFIFELDPDIKATPGLITILGHIPLEGLIQRNGNASHEKAVVELNKKLQGIAKE